jgi:hypothetical protein
MIGLRYATIDIPNELPVFAQMLINHSVDEVMLGVVPDTEYRSELIKACKRTCDKAIVDWLETVSANKEGIPLSYIDTKEVILSNYNKSADVPNDYRLVTAEMILFEYNVYLERYCDSRKISAQALSKLIEKNGNGIIKAGERQRIMGHRQIPYFIVCSDSRI